MDAIMTCVYVYIGIDFDNLVQWSLRLYKISGIPYIALGDDGGVYIMSRLAYDLDCAKGREI